MSRHGLLAAGLTAMLLLAAMSACGGDGGSSSTGGSDPGPTDIALPAPTAAPVLPTPETTAPPPAPPLPAPPASYARTSPDECGNGYPVALVVQAESPDEVASLTQISACGSLAGDRTYLRNRSALVWQIWVDTAVGPVTTTHSAPTPAQVVLQRVAGSQSVMEPGSGIEIPAPPGTVHWYADPVLTGVYTQTVELEQQAIEAGITKSPQLFRTGSRARAHLTCAVTGYQAGSAAWETYDADTVDIRTQAIAEGVESVLSSAGECRTALQQADVEEVADARLARKVLPQIELTPRPLRVQVVARPVARTWPVVLRTVVRAVTPG